jgi:glycosyltransferase involved in cell wall biosynthesis
MFYGLNLLHYNLVIILSANSSWYLYNFRKNTIKALLAEGYQVTCLSVKDSYTNKLIDLGCNWEQLYIDRKGLNIFKEVFLLLSIIKIFKKINPSVVLNFTIKNNIYGTLAAKIMRIPVINNISGLGTTFIRDEIRYKFIRFLYSFALSLSSKVFCQNQDDKNLLINILGVKNNLIELTPGSGVDTKRFHPDLKNTHVRSNQNFRFLFAGRLLADKGIFELIEAAKKLTSSTNIKFELWLVGFNNNDNISSIPLNVINQWSKVSNIFFFEPTEHIEKILCQVDCLVLPSYREGLPKSVLEACSMSLPVICSDVPGCNSIIIDSYNGFLCKAGCSQSLMESMMRMLSISELQRNEMGFNGRELMLKKFKEDIVINQTVGAIKTFNEL